MRKYLYLLTLLLMIAACQQDPLPENSNLSSSDSAMLKKDTGLTAAPKTTEQDEPDSAAWDLETLKKVDSIERRFGDKPLKYHYSQWIDVTGDGRKEKAESQVYMLNDTFYTSQSIVTTDKKMIYSDTIPLNEEDEIGLYYNDPISRKLYFRKRPYSAFYAATRMANFVRYYDSLSQMSDLASQNSIKEAMKQAGFTSLKVNEDDTKEMAKKYLKSFKGKLIAFPAGKEMRKYIWFEPAQRFVQVKPL